MRFIDIKTDGILKVSRQGFYFFLKHRDDPWKYEGVAEKMRAIITVIPN